MGINICIFVLSFSKAIVMMMLVVFCTTSIAADCINCVCAAKQEVKKEMKCCLVKKEMKCCSDKEKKCGKTDNKSDKDCNKCTMKKSDVQNPITTNENKISGSKIIKISDVNLSFNTFNPGIISYNSWRPPDKTCKIFLALSNFRI
ncbi:MAG: hypothetical protein NTU73_12315 [Ignavibacteriae bacterium]|nr:hypothetical protein [Ignavibacteriota bacterium]